MKTEIDSRATPTPLGPIVTRSTNPALIAAARDVNRACAERPLGRAAVRRSLARLGAIRAVVRAVEKLTKGGVGPNSNCMDTPLPDKAGAARIAGGLRLDHVEVALWVGARAARNGVVEDVAQVFPDSQGAIAFRAGVLAYRAGDEPELAADVDQLAAVEFALMQLKEAGQ